LAIIDGLVRLEVGNSLGTLTINARRIWMHPPFERPPLCIFNQKERTTDSEIIVVGEIVEEDKREEASEKEGESNSSSKRGVSVISNLTTKIHIRGVGLRVTMANQDNSLSLPIFHRTSKCDVEKNWFMCEAICSVKRISEEATNIT
jgi:hypothetical protein